MNPTIAAVTERIVERSGPTRAADLERCRCAAEAGVGARTKSPMQAPLILALPNVVLLANKIKMI
jgi:hypothetical protein